MCVCAILFTNWQTMSTKHNYNNNQYRSVSRLIVVVVVGAVAVIAVLLVVDVPNPWLLCPL